MEISIPDAKNAPVLSRIDGLPADFPLVSAIIPAYNSEKFIHRAIESALSQTHRLLEIIVVDDGSNDGTAQAAGRFPVMVIRQENGGPASARNAGARGARGEWLAFLDHDDSWHPQKTEEQLKYIRPGISAVFSGKYPGKENVTFAEMFDRNYGGNPSSTIVRADVLRTLGYFDEDPALKGLDDYNLWLRFLLAGYKFASTPLLYNFTPERNHYGANLDKMLAAELVNIDKTAELARLPQSAAEERKQRARLARLPELIHFRFLQEARKQIRILGLSRQTAKYCVAFLPTFLLDLGRAVRKFDKG